MHNIYVSQANLHFCLYNAYFQHGKLIIHKINEIMSIHVKLQREFKLFVHFVFEMLSFVLNYWANFI